MPQAHLVILLLENPTESSQQVQAQLVSMGHEVITARDAETGLALFHAHQPDAMLLDVDSPEPHAYRLTQQIRRQENGRWTPIYFMSCHYSDQDIQKGIDAGGDDCLIKPLSDLLLQSKLVATQRQLAMRNQLMSTMDELRTTNYRLRHLCSHDELTGLSNRRGFNERLTQYLGQARREQRPLTLIMCDIDHFKRYNDKLGHVEGDRCLQHMGGLLANACKRPLDHCSRFGGEEFAILLPYTSAEGATAFTLSLLHQLITSGLAHPDSPVAPHVTVSGGFTSCIPDAHTTPDMLLRLADESLYAAKQRGRHRFVDISTGTDTAQWMSDIPFIDIMGAPNTHSQMHMAA
jgi:diguanylate cyclase (GGDEF)-like protein